MIFGLIVFCIIIGFFIWRNIQQTREITNARKAEKERAEAEERATEQRRIDDQNYLEKTRLGDAKAIERFYQECSRNGIKGAATDADKARIVLYAQSKKIQGTEEELIAAYLGGKKIADYPKIKELDQEENTEVLEQTAYINYRGRDKMVHYLEDQIDYYTREIDFYEKAYKASIETDRKAAERMYYALKKSETDWAVAGGIATGIAGPAAGLVTAVGVQQNNNAIRANNAALLNAISDITSKSSSQIYDYLTFDRKWKERHEAELEAVQLCLVQDIDVNTLFKQLNVVVHETKITETGAAKIKIEIIQPEGLKIYDDVPALIDGFLKATLFNSKDHSEIGSFVFGFDYWDVRSQKGWTGGGGYISYKIYKEKPIPNDYTVEISPVDLWAIENFRQKIGKE